MVIVEYAIVGHLGHDLEIRNDGLALLWVQLEVRVPRYLVISFSIGHGTSFLHEADAR